MNISKLYNGINFNCLTKGKLKDQKLVKTSHHMQLLPQINPNLMIYSMIMVKLLLKQLQEEILKVLIFGGSGGIGKNLADYLSPKHEVTCTYFNQSLDANNSQYETRKLDLRNQSAVSNFLENSSNFDVVINAAGISGGERIGQINPLTFEEVMNVNLISPTIAANWYIPKMLESGFGRFIFIGSIIGQSGGIGLTSYSASKSGLSGVLKSINLEMQLYKVKFPNADVTVNMVSPGYVDTPMTNSISTKIQEILKSKSTIKRFLEPSEISRVIEFLISEESCGISGAEFSINGGMTI
jgi:NAD(P)-dependent dehydrogenase (short-subunit alcohol dehydrogenase family)